jgi:hypothetical protein
MMLEERTAVVKVKCVELPVSLPMAVLSALTMIGLEIAARCMEKDGFVGIVMAMV